MDLVARLDPSNARWSDGSVEYVTVTVTRTDGDLDNGDVTGVGVGSYDDDPLAWYPPVNPEHSPTANEVTVQLLIGTTVQPVGRVYPWVRVVRDGETVYRCARNAALDFTDNEWGAPTPPSVVNLYGSGVYGAGVYSSAA